MSFPDITSLGIEELLACHDAVIDELRKRNILRSKNNPTGDYAEWLVSTKLGFTLEANSVRGFDAIDALGYRYQIKGRRVTAENRSTQLGAIRNLVDGEFDFLIGVLFDSAWRVERAVKIPHQVISKLASFRRHVNAHVLCLRPSILQFPEVQDITHVFE